MLNKKALVKYGIVGLLCLVALGVTVIGFGLHQTRAAAPSLPGLSASSSGPAKDALSLDISTKTLTALEYWTPTRMKAAKSADILLTTKAVTPPADSGIPKLGIKAVSIDPVLPSGKKENASKASEQQAGTQQTAASAVAYPYTFPYVTVGKVFFTDPKTGTDYVCSGTAVASANNDTIDTAGHCVANGGNGYFYTNWVFCGNYNNGCPTGYMWAARRLVTHSNWYNKGWLTYDYGEAVVNPNKNGDVTSTIGGAGLAYNQAYQQQYMALGYPQTAPYDGTKLWKCVSGVTGRDQPNPKGSPTLAIACDMTGGASGGGWLISVKGKAGYVNGHNDYKYSRDSQHMYSPYYGPDWYKVYNTAQSE
jgi:V8-like Glu-specific endopeptidase